MACMGERVQILLFRQQSSLSFEDVSKHGECISSAFYVLYVLYTRMPGESNHWRLKSLCLCDSFKERDGHHKGDNSFALEHSNLQR